MQSDMDILLVRSLVCGNVVSVGHIIDGHYSKVGHSSILCAGFNSWQHYLNPDLLDECVAEGYATKFGNEPLIEMRLTELGIKRGREVLHSYLNEMSETWADEFRRMEPLTEVLMRDYCLGQPEQPGRNPFELAIYYDNEPRPQRGDGPIILDFMKAFPKVFHNFELLLDKLYADSLCVRVVYKNEHTKTMQNQGSRLHYLHTEYRTIEDIYNWLRKIMPESSEGYNEKIQPIRMYSMLSHWKNNVFGRRDIKFVDWVNEMGFNGAEWLMLLEAGGIKVSNTTRQPIVKDEDLQILEKRIFEKEEGLAKL